MHRLTVALGITRFGALLAPRHWNEPELKDEAAAERHVGRLGSSGANEGHRVMFAGTTRRPHFPPEHREIVNPVYYYDKSMEELARIVGVPENTMKARLAQPVWNEAGP